LTLRESAPSEAHKFGKHGTYLHKSVERDQQ
jgi:hypothetical protein